MIIFINSNFVVEMFEHMKNYGSLLAKLNKWLKEDGKLFVHIFTHDKCSYHFERGNQCVFCHL